MAIEMVRVPSETPNISNTDDFVGLRYAYGNQNGYVINKGLECSFTPLSAKFRINSGRLVLQGVEVDIDANGVEVAIDNVANTQYHTVYLKVDLSTNEAKILTMSDTSTYPTIESGDDLTQNTTGIAKMELYHFDATSGVISNVQNIVEKIEYTGTALVDYDISKGTVEERLDALGFKQSAIANKDWAVGGRTFVTKQPYVQENILQRQGNYVILRLFIPGATPTYESQFFMLDTDPMSSTYYAGTIATIPENFRPKTKITNHMYWLAGPSAYTNFDVVINTDGNITIRYSTINQIQGIAIYCGYEANPL